MVLWDSFKKIQKVIPFLKENSKMDIAIIGMACRFPGAKNYKEFWKNLVGGISSIREIPPDRWDIGKYYSPNIEEPNKSTSKWGGFLDSIDRFDSQFFNILPREAKSMDPQQRILLEESWHCIEDSGIPLKELQRHKTSVYIGVMAVDYQQIIANTKGPIDRFTCLGSYEGILANRLSYFLNITGESKSLNAACASSLVALHNARQSLLGKECDFALVAGVSAICHPWKYISFSKSHMLSPDGKCKTFDKDANGYVPGEGVGVLLLCSLSKARKEGYHVYGVLKGSAVNHGGKTNSITVPCIVAQKEVIQLALESGNIEPKTITYIETHGTGTSLGDPIEVEALTQAFQTQKRQFCTIGSVKTNIGHLEAASGIAGVIKVLLMMMHRKIPRTLNINVINPLINFRNTPFKIAITCSDWDPWHPRRNRRAGVSSFGFGGVNAHVILEECNLPKKKRRESKNNQTLPFVLSSKTEASLIGLIKEWQEYVKGNEFESLELEDICKTLLYAREPFQCRFGKLVQTKEELINHLRNINIYEVGKKGFNDKSPNEVVFCIGSMETIDIPKIQTMYQKDAFFKHYVDECVSYIKNETGSKWFPWNAYANGNIETRNLSLFTVLYALAMRFMDYGIQPAIISGEKIGYLVAAILAGITNLKSIIKFLVKKTQSPIILKRPRIQFYIPQEKKLFSIFSIKKGYFEQLLKKITIPHDAYKICLEKTRLLIGYQYTFIRLMDEWKLVLMKRNINLKDLIEDDKLPTLNDAQGKARATIMFVIMMVCLEKLSRKWALRHAVILEESPLSEIIDLVMDGVLSYEEILGLIIEEAEEQRERCARSVERNLDHLDKNKPYRILRSWNDSHDELASTWQGIASWEIQYVEETPKPFNVDKKNTIIVTIGTCKKLKKKEGDVIINMPVEGDISKNVTVCLLELWLAGLPITWEGYMNFKEYNRVSLPGYVFDQHSFWLNDKYQTTKGITNENASLIIECFNKKESIISLPPLVEMNNSTLGEQRIRNTVTKEEYYHRDRPAEEKRILDGGIQGEEKEIEYQILEKEWHYVPFKGNQSISASGTVMILSSEDTKILATHIFESTPAMTSIIIQKGEVYEHPSNYYYTVPIDQIYVIKEVVRSILDDGHLITGLIDLSDLHDYSVSRSESIEARIILLQELLLKKKQGVSFPIIHITKGLQTFKTKQATIAGANYAGLIRMLGSEYKEVMSKTIDIDYSLENYREIQEIILNEFFYPDEVSEICYRENKRYIPEMQSIYCSSVKEEMAGLSLTIDSEKVYVITGGMKGIGSLVGRYLVEKGVKKLVLMGREKLPPREDWEISLASIALGEETKKKISHVMELERQGVQVRLYSGQLTEKDRLLKYFEDIRKEYGEIAGVIHCAGEMINKNPAFIKKDIRDILRVMEPKVKSLEVLHEVFIKDKLCFFIVFSSVSAQIPVLGSSISDYAQVNAFMDYFVNYQLRIGKTYYKSIQWPSWRETGIGEVRSEIYHQMGLLSLSNAEGLYLLERVMGYVDKVCLMPIKNDKMLFHRKQLLKTRPQITRGLNTLVITQVEDSNEAQAKNLFVIISTWLKKVLSEELKIAENHLDEETNFGEFGVDSILLAELVRKIEMQLAIKLNPSLLLEYPTIHRLSSYLGGSYNNEIKGFFSQDTSQSNLGTGQNQGALIGKITASSDKEAPSSIAMQNQTQSALKKRDIKIAVIGVGCHFPGAKDKNAYWDNLSNGKCAIKEVPESRWIITQYYQPEYAAGKSISKWGGFIGGIEDFDPQYFSFSEEDAPQIDPLVRQFLEVSVETIRDAGYEKEAIYGKQIGVFVGSRISNFAYKIKRYTKNSIVGIGQNFIAAHVSHFFNLKGPSLVVDTACSSSLVSIHLACQSLMYSEVEMAIAGGVDILLDEALYVILSEAKALSPDGKCYTFDEKANGFVPGEGCGAVLLKRLENAIYDGDQIYAIIEATAVNNDGRTMGITTPNPEAQKEVIRQALRNGDIDPTSISYIETHGTGTMIGDPIELKGLTSVFKESTDECQFCAVGSVKTNVGHLLSAAGIASFIKVVLALHNKKIPPSLNCEEPNPRFNFNQSPFYPNTLLKEWAPRNGIRRAGISSFGFGGTNAHVIICECDQQVLRNYNQRRFPLGPAIFKRSRYWIDSKGKNEKHELVSSRQREENNTQFQRYLYEEIIYDTDQIKEFEVYVGNENFIVRDHRVYGVRIMPGVTYLDMILRIVDKYFKDQFHPEEIVLRHVTFYKPLATSEDFDRKIRVQFKRQERYWKISLKSTRILHNDQDETIWDEIAGCELHKEKLNILEEIDIDSFKHQAITIFDMDEVYGYASTVGIEHYEFMKTQGTIYRGNDYAMMELSIGEMSKEYNPQFYIHPAFLDGSTFLEIALNLDIEKKGQVIVPHIPLYIKEFRIFSDRPDRCYVYGKKQKQGLAADILISDIKIYNGQGKPVAMFVGLSLKQIRTKDLITRLKQEKRESFTRNQEDRFVTLKEDDNIVQKESYEECLQTIEDDGLRTFIEKDMKEQISQKLNKSKNEIPLDIGYYDIGLDSRHLMEIVRELEEKLGVKLYPTLLFEYPSIKELAGYLAKNFYENYTKALQKAGIITKKEVHAKGQAEINSSHEKMVTSDKEDVGSASIYESFFTRESIQESDIAIIGMSGRYPQAGNLSEYWENLKSGRDCIIEIPNDRWNQERYYSKNKEKKKTSYCKWGGFIADVDRFDPLFFNISPREAMIIDPQERIFLETVWQALEDAGYTRGLLAENSVGVFVGVMWGEYQLYGNENRELTPGSIYASIANRVSYVLNLRGPSIALDTMCSSSLTAIHLACESIRRGEIDLAIAGGVNVSIHPNKYIVLSQWNFLSSDGRCRSFGEGGDGYVPGEGVGAILLKPLRHAERDGDQIYGVIKGSAVNHGGKTNGYTVPNPNAQGALIQEVLRKAKIDPRTISYVEAHGTGTSLGDPIEIRGLSQAFGECTKDKQYCPIGSVKSNIGHLESAAGIAALTKVLLQMRYKMLVPSIHAEQLNPNINFDETPFYVQRELSEWKQPVVEEDGVRRSIARRAGINSFGAGGANAYIIVEEYEQSVPVSNNEKQEPQIIVLSAKNEDRLKEYVREMVSFLGKQSVINLTDMAYTLQIGREAMEERLALVVNDVEELKMKLEEVIQGKGEGERIYRGNVRVNEEKTDLLIEGDEGSGFIKTVIQNKKLNKLAQLWVSGLEIDWRPIHQQGSVLRISLPTYPFARERYWITDEDGGRGTSLRDSGVASLHPLIDRNDSTLEEQCFRKMVTGEEYYLRGHRIGGERILPGVVYLEMARVAGDLANKHAHVRVLKNIIWSSPIMMNGTDREIIIGLYPDKDGVEYEIRTQENEEVRVHSQGRLIYGDRKQWEGETLIIEEIRKRLTQRMEKEAIYGQFSCMGFNYGENFQVIEWIESCEDEAIGMLRLPEELEEEFDKYGMHPIVMDGALQTVLGLYKSDRGEAIRVLPFSIELLTIIDTLPKTGYAVVKRAEYNQGDGGIWKYDIKLCDESGKVVIDIQGFSIRVISVNYRADTTRIGVRYYTRSWQRSEIPKGIALHGTVLILSDDEKFVEGLRQIEQGVNTIQVRTGQGYKALGSNCYEIDRHRSEDYAQLLQVFKETGIPTNQIIYIQDEKEGGVEEGVMCFYELTRVLVSDKVKGEVSALVLYPHAEKTIGQQEMVSGFARSVRLENPRYRYRVIGLDGKYEKLEYINEIIMAELGAKDDDVHVRYDDEGRWVNRIQPIETEVRSDVMLLRQRGTYLITGGMGGLGLIFARYLAEQVKARLILIGRTELDEEKKRQIREIEILGAEVLYVRADITKLSDLEMVIREGKEHFGSVNGVIHSAGIIRDAFLMNKDREVFQEVLAPKVLGTMNLDQATREEPLDFFVLFSSIASVMGNVGQSDYAAGNGYMDGYASYREKLRMRGECRGKTLSINWPLWREGGMKVDEKTEEFMRKNLGVVPLATKEGIKAFEIGLKSNVSQLAVINGDQNKIGEILNRSKKGEKGSDVKADVSDKDKKFLQERAEHYLKERLSRVIKLPVTRISSQEPFEQYGIDSVMVVDFNRKMEEHFGELPKTLLFEHRNISSLAGYFVEFHAGKLYEILGLSETADGEKKEVLGEERPLKSLEKSRFISPRIGYCENIENNDDIAIIGMSGRYPKALNLEEYWENLKKGKSCIREIPQDRWDCEKYYDCDHNKEGKYYNKWGGFIEGVDKFDPMFFNISPREAISMDPQERLFLETAWAALEDAGYTRKDIEKVRKVGVFVGVMNSAYGRIGAEVLQKEDVFNFIQPAYWSIANRVSYFLNIQGPSVAIDTACSSSLTAVHIAVENLKHREIEMALVGGVHLILHPSQYIGLSLMRMLSGDEKCKPFGEGADGFIDGEGVGCILLKPLNQAIRDNDCIYGVIKGSAVNHGGKTNGYTVPSPNAQGALIQEVLRKAKIDPRTISYVEAHGTGTSLGDPIEIRGLSQAFGEWTKDKQYCPIGSVKSNIGHLESAAGIAALTKVLLQMRYKMLVPSIHAEQLNPNINFDETPFYVQRELSEWKQPVVEEDGVRRSIARRAGISSFGAGGANVHIIVEEYDKSVPVSNNEKQEPQIIVLSAKNEDRLKEYVREMVSFLGRQSVINLTDMAYTLQIGREAMEERLALVVNDVEELKAKLEEVIQGKGDKERIYRGNVRTSEGKSELLIDGEAGTEFIRIIRKNKELTKLAQLWVSGVEIDWRLIRQQGSVRRISLPTYPFARERYWITATISRNVNMDFKQSITQHQDEVKDTILLEGSKKLVLKKLNKTKVDSIERNLKDIDIQVNLADLRDVYITKSKEDIICTEYDSDINEEKIKYVIKEIICRVLYLDRHQVEEEKTFIDLGMDSILGVEIVKAINTELKIDISATKLYDYYNLKLLAGYIYTTLKKGLHSDKETEIDKEGNNIEHNQESNKHFHKNMNNVKSNFAQINLTNIETSHNTDLTDLKEVSAIINGENKFLIDQNPEKGIETLKYESSTQTDSCFQYTEDDECFDLSEGQKALWFIHKLLPDDYAYNIPMAFRIKGTLDKYALKCTFQKLILRHSIFRTNIKDEKGIPFQVVNSDQEMCFIEVDISHLNWEECLMYVKKVSRQPFDLENGPLMRIHLFNTKEKEYILLITLHHIIFDGMSVPILITEFIQTYNAAVKGNTLLLPPLKYNYSDFVTWQKKMLESKISEQHSEFWRKKLSGSIPVLNLPTDFPRSMNQTYSWNFYMFELSSDIVMGIESLAKSEKVTQNTVALGAYYVFLKHITQQEDIMIRTVTSGRSQASFNPLLGYFVNPIAIREQIFVNLSFSEFLKQLYKDTLEILDHSDYPFSLVIKHLDMKHNGEREPLSQVAFLFQGWGNKIDYSLISAIDNDNLHIETIMSIRQTGAVDLSLEILYEKEKCFAYFHYNAEIFKELTISRFASYYQTILNDVILNPHKVISEITILPENERHKILVDFNNTEIDYPREKTLVELFEKQVESVPENIAVLFDNKELSYLVLNEQANQVAHYLREHYHIEPDDLVGVMMERSDRMIVALLGILKSGGAYVPIDPEYPKERVRYILEDSGCNVVITDSKYKSSLESIPGINTPSIDIGNIPQSSVENPAHRSNPCHLAYVIYTSGSTGRPKGVMVEHRGFINMIIAQQQGFGITSADRILQFASPSFDASLYEVFMALLTGCVLVLIRKEIINTPDNFVQHLNENKVTVALLPPTFLRMLRQHPLPTIKTLITAGEPANSVDALFYSMTKQYINAYGPTETSVCATYYKVNPEKSYHAGIPIGKPIANTSIHIISESVQLVPIGVVGEICISGEGLARGYINNPNLTQEKFIENPLKMGERLYRTGDIGRWLPDGNIEFLGRKDEQVKIRGYRIECGEVEQTLLRYPGIGGAVVIAREVSEDTKVLVGYIVSKEGINVSELRSYLKEHLPEYMIPSWFVRLESIPLTPNGKIDKKALPTPEGMEIGTGREYVAPRDEIERQLVKIWQEVLKKEKIGIHDDYFELGGDSIQAIHLVSKLSKVLNQNIPVRYLMMHPTIESFSNNIGIQKVSKEGHLECASKQITFPQNAKDYVCEVSDLQDLSEDYLKDAVLDDSIILNNSVRNMNEISNSIFITGATGFLGTYLLSDLLLGTDARIYCLVRGPSKSSVFQKLRKNLQDISNWNVEYESRILPVIGDLSLPLFGLSDEEFSNLAETVDVIYHNGALVNFIYPYEQLKACNVSGTKEVLKLAVLNKVKIVNYVSTMSVYGSMAYNNSTTIREDTTSEGKNIYGGYSQSKWVSERLVDIASTRGIPVRIFRPGLITGDSLTGYFNHDDFFAIILKIIVGVGYAPELNISMGMIPVDFVSKAVVYLSAIKTNIGGKFHLVNYPGIHFNDLILWFNEIGYTVQTVDYKEWVKKIQIAFSDTLDKSIKAIMPVFTDKIKGDLSFLELIEQVGQPIYDIRNTVEWLERVKLKCPPIDNNLLKIYYNAYVKNGLLTEPRKK